MPNNKYKIGYLVKNVVSGEFSDTTAKKDKILDGETAYVKNSDGNVELITGNIQTYAGETEQSSMTIAELVQAKKNADYLFLNYKSETIPISYNDTEGVVSFVGTFAGTTANEIPEINTESAQNLTNMYANAQATLISPEKPIQTFRFMRRNLTRVEQFMNEIGNTDWGDITWSTIKIGKDVRSIPGLLYGANNVVNVKIINNSSKVSINYDTTLKSNYSLKNLWLTDCSTIDKGIEQLATRCEVLENLVLENLSNVTFIRTLNSYDESNEIKNVYIDGLKKYVDGYGIFSGSSYPKLENIKLLDCENVESLFYTFHNSPVKTVVVGNPHVKNISIKKFTTFNYNNVDYDVPHLNYFEPGTILYSSDSKRYYKITDDHTYERLSWNIEDEGIVEAPIVKVNKTLTSLNSKGYELLKASLDCFQTGAIIYSTVDDKYYQKDIVTKEWNIIEQPINYPLKQSTTLLKDLSTTFYGCENLSSIIFVDASHVGEWLNSSMFGGGYTSIKQTEPYMYIQCKSYGSVSDLLENPNKLKYFRNNSVIYWQDTKKYYEIIDGVASEIDIEEYLKENDNVPRLATNKNYCLIVAFNHAMQQYYSSYGKDIAYIYDSKSNKTYKVYKISAQNKSIYEIPTSNYSNGDLIIAKDYNCYKLIDGSWVKQTTIHTYIPAKSNLTGDFYYGVEETSVTDYTVVFNAEYNATEETLGYFGVDNVVYYNSTYYKIVETSGTYSTEVIDDIDSYLSGKNVLNVDEVSRFENIEESIKFQDTLKHFEVLGTTISDGTGYPFQYDRLNIKDWNDGTSTMGATTYAFSGCTNLKTLRLPGMSISFDISASTAFEESDIIQIFSDLSIVESTQTITLNTKYQNLSENIRCIATDKNWTIAFK